ncbi:MAG TPA: hypothetical protein VD863_14885 [Bradyrhizobium sp.]|nr:hypothetical protein [Bradyrhizobium sp.]
MDFVIVHPPFAFGLDGCQTLHFRRRIRHGHRFDADRVVSIECVQRFFIFSLPTKLHELPGDIHGGHVNLL